MSDDALARAIREGIGFDGRALFPLMPWQEYRMIPDEDLAAAVRSRGWLDTRLDRFRRRFRPEPPDQVDDAKRGVFHHDGDLVTKTEKLALLDGKVDLAVHSHKDLPTESPEGLVVAAEQIHTHPCPQCR